MILRECFEKRDLDKIEALYEAAFPACERKLFSVMAEKAGQGVDLLAIEDEGAFCGLAIVLVYGAVALLDYFAVMPEKRGGGIGGAALALLKEKYAGRALLIEIEDPDEASENRAERVRRKAFYLKNGMVEMDYKVWFYGTKMQVMTSGVRVDFPGHIAVYENVLGNGISKNITLF